MSSSSANDNTTKEDDVEETKIAIQATAITIGMRPSIFCLGPWEVRKKRSMLSVLGIGFPAVGC